MERGGTNGEKETAIEKIEQKSVLYKGW